MWLKYSKVVHTQQNRWTFCSVLKKYRSTMKCMATHKRQQTCCRKLPVQLWEEVIKTTRTDWQAEWWWKSSKNDMINSLQSGAHAVWMCLCPCVCPGGQRSSAGVSDDSHYSDVAVVQTEADNSGSSSLHDQRNRSDRTLPDLCQYVYTYVQYDVCYKTTSLRSQHSYSLLLGFHYVLCFCSLFPLKLRLGLLIY